MNNKVTYNLFSNFQSTVFRAVRAFLEKNKLADKNKSITSTLRIPEEIKEFYECIAEAEMTSINTAIVNTLSKVKYQTIDEYQKSYTKINDAYDYQINSFLKIIDDQKIDYNDLSALLEWVTGTKINRNDITDKERLINIIDKNAQITICRTFGYSYHWLQNNDRSIYYEWPGFKDRWYKNVQPFIRDLITNFYLDETVESFGLSFLCCDIDIVNNIISGITPKTDEMITPIVIANRCINGVKTRTFHRLESNNINYQKCRNHFIVLIKMIFVLVKHKVLSFPNGYLVTPQQHDTVLDGSTHLSELFNNTHLSNDFYLEDIVSGFTPDDDKNYTDKPDIFHCLNQHFISDILSGANTDKRLIELTDELASKCSMNKTALAKYLRLFELNNHSQTKSSVFFPSERKDCLILNLARIRELQSELQNCKSLNTNFG